MNALFEAAKEVGGFMSARKWRHCVIGGLAVLRWGEPRTTLDVDIALMTGFGGEQAFAEALLASFKGRGRNPLKFALRHRVLLVRASNGKDVDIAFAAFPFEEQMMQRATPFQFDEDVRVVTCSAEDLFILKVFAGRDKDWQDAESVAIRQKLDNRYVLKHLKPMCEVKDAPERLERARRVLGTNQ